MNADTSEAALVGIDWGTSTLRAYLISAKGEGHWKVCSVNSYK